ncbi:hypothetical protein VYU27_002480 [Nannochloropsis oceanica]
MDASPDPQDTLAREMQRKGLLRPLASSSSALPAIPPALHVAFLHLDLGIGGAEQLVVNAAVALQQRGHRVTLWTTHHDPTHCFAETRGDGPLAPHVRVAGDWLPRQILGRFRALCAVVRMLYLAFMVGLLTRMGELCWWHRRGNEDRKQQQQQLRHDHIDIVFCDGVSAMVPLLRFLWRFPVLFYCHFPDKLLCTDRASLIKRCYRAPLDRIEESTTGAATLIAVNSHFTAQVFTEAFPSLPSRHGTPAVIYPAINLKSFVPPKAAAAATTTITENAASRGNVANITRELRPFVSLNRFERKKNIGLALEALALVRTSLQHQAEDQKLNQENLLKELRLIIAGGYDDAVVENKEYMRELQSQAQQLDLSDCVSFQPSISDATRATLLQEALAVLYTPDREHFGIVPLEAMYAGSPVLAVASGGPLETVLHGKTGFLCEGTGKGFAEAMLRLLRKPESRDEMGRVGHEYVKEKFGLDAFATTLEKAVLDTRTRAREGEQIWRGGIIWVLVMVGMVMLAQALLYK